MTTARQIDEMGDRRDDRLFAQREADEARLEHDGELIDLAAADVCADADLLMLSIIESQPDHTMETVFVNFLAHGKGSETALRNCLRANAKWYAERVMI